MKKADMIKTEDDLKKYPYCDTCGKPAVWTKCAGWLHATIEYPFGVPRNIDDSFHRVTARIWSEGVEGVGKC